MAAIASALLTTSVAQATNFGPFYAGDAAHDFINESLGAYWTAASTSGRAQIDFTDMTATLYTTNHNSRDVAVYDENVGDDGAYAQTSPQTIIGNLWLHVHVIYNTFYTPTSDNVNGIACHEFGHSVGLGHRSTDVSCMEFDGTYPSFYSVHDIIHVNGRY